MWSRPPAAALLFGFALAGFAPSGGNPAEAAVVVPGWDSMSQIGRAQSADDRSGPAERRDDTPAANLTGRSGTAVPPVTPDSVSAALPAAAAVAAGGVLPADLPRDRRHEAVFSPGGLFRPPRSA